MNALARGSAGRLPGAGSRVAAPALFLVLCLAAPGGAQDIEAVARARGIELPQAYYARIAADPTAFTLPNGLFRVTEAGPQPTAASGTHQLLVVPALFADSEEPHITQEMVQQSLFDGPAARGTVTEAYLEISRGALTLNGTVTPWVRTSIDMFDAVGTGNGLGDDGDLGPYFVEALQLADPLVDFGAFDNDGPDGVPNSGDDDGFVDAMTFEFLEIAGSCGGPSIWPHRWGITGWTGAPFITTDERALGGFIRVDGYIVQGVTDCGGVRVQDANVIAHEYGHVLGMPDYYHPTASGGAAGRRWVIGCWELMAAGSWGCGPVDDRSDPFGPTHMSARTKHALGWLSYVQVGSVRDHEVFLDPVQASGQALRVPLDPDGVESLIFEYRTRTGFDAQIPADGVLIYHQDDVGTTRPDPASGAPYFLSVVEQDDDDGLQRNSYEGGDRGVAGDAWGVDGLLQRYHYLTAPRLRTHDGSATSVVVHEIAVENGQARIRLSTAATPELLVSAGSLDFQPGVSFETRLRVAGGIMPFEPVGGVPAGVVMSVEGDELVVTGEFTGEGPVAFVLGVEDAAGNAAPSLVTRLNDEGWSVTDGTLLEFFLGGQDPALTPAELAYLDALGNGNGRYDVGDLRKWLREGNGGG